MEKYWIVEDEAEGLADFLIPMLSWDPEDRITAQDALKSWWLTMADRDVVKISEKEHNALILKKKLMDIDNDAEKKLVSPSEALLWAEADNEDNLGRESKIDDLFNEDSDSDFEVPSEWGVGGWKTKRNVA